MPMIEEAKRIIERVTGLGRPKPAQLAALTRAAEPRALRFEDDGRTPNNPHFPLLIYRRAVRLRDFDPAAVFEDLFARNGWKDSWRDGIYPFLHFHTATHEVLGIARGHARVQFGGSSGKVIAVKAGDVVVLPAGTGHRRIAQSDDLLVVGAYPAGGRYDEPRPDEVDHKKAVESITKVRRPAKDPVFGKAGPLLALWRAGRAARKPARRRAKPRG